MRMCYINLHFIYLLTNEKWSGLLLQAAAPYLFYVSARWPTRIKSWSEKFKRKHKIAKIFHSGRNSYDNIQSTYNQYNSQLHACGVLLAMLGMLQMWEEDFVKIMTLCHYPKKSLFRCKNQTDKDRQNVTFACTFISNNARRCRRQSVAVVKASTWHAPTETIEFVTDAWCWPMFTCERNHTRRLRIGCEYWLARLLSFKRPLCQSTCLCLWK